MTKLKILIIALILTACSSAPKSGHFTADCDYTVGDDGKVNLTCVQVITPVPTGTIQPTSTVIVPTAIKTTTSVPNATPTVVPSTVTATSVPSNVNLFKNPDFESGFDIFTWPSGLRLPEIAAAISWSPFFCDFPYKTAPCPAKFQGIKNPSNLLMGRPEMRGTDVPNRVHSKKYAQYSFCQFRACDGGVYQTVKTQPNQQCTASAYVQSWSRIAWDPKLKPEQNFMSGFPNDDAYSNSLWRIAVDPYGGENIDDSRVVKSSWYSQPRSITSVDNQVIEYLDHYDKYALISFTFTAKGTSSTIFFENLRLFPFTFNDSMIDDASVVCSGGVPHTATPTPSSTPISITPANAVYTVVKPVINVRSTRNYNIDTNITRVLHFNDKVTVHCVVEEKTDEFWGSESSCNTASEWMILRIGTEDYATSPDGPEGT